MSLSVSKIQQSTHSPNFSFFIKQPSQLNPTKINQILSSFITCPFLSIRQLLVSFFILFPVKQPPLSPQSLLIKQYKQYPQHKRLDQILLLHIYEYKQERRKHEYLIDSLDQFVEGVKEIKRLKQECEGELRGVISIEHSELIENLENQFVRLEQLNVKYQLAINKFTGLYHYSEYLMSALHQIIKYSNLRNIYPNKQTVQKYLNDLKQSLNGIIKDIEQVQGEKIRIRHKVKFDEFSQADIANKKENKVKKIQQIYYLIYKLSPLIKHQMNELTPVGKKIKQQYIKFLEIYIECNELQQTKNNKEMYIEIIRQQKISLTQHLKKNNDLMARFTRSTNYSDFLSYIKSKVHIYKMFGAEIEEIEHAIKFINQDYEPLFKQLCEGKGRAAGEQLKREVEYFMKGSQEGYNVIILNFLTKLQQI